MSASEASTRRPHTPGVLFLLVALAASAFLAAACTVIDADDYSLRDPDAGDGAAQIALPLLPAQPDPDVVETCQECVQARCTDEYERCLNSELCRDLLACNRDCDDPNCIYRCRDIHPPSANFEDLFGCAFGQFRGPVSGALESRCGDECNAGGNWECAGEYSWDPQEEDAVVEVRAFNSAAVVPGTDVSTFPFVDFASCTDASRDGIPRGDTGCGPFHSVDGHGVAHLAVTRFHAAVAMQRGLNDEERQRFYDRPMSRSGRLDLEAQPTQSRLSFLPANFANRSPPVEITEEHGMVFFWVNDCTGVRAKARVEMADAVRFYWIGIGKLDTEETDGTRGGFVAAEPRLTARLAAYVDGEIVAEASGVVAAGWTTNVRLLPRAR